MKPFYVKAEGVSYENQQELLDLAVDAGATLVEHRTCTRHETFGNLSEIINNFNYFGVDCTNGTNFSYGFSDFGDNAVEMTYDEAWEYVTGIIRAKESPKPVSREEAIEWLRENTTREDWEKEYFTVGGWNTVKKPWNTHSWLERGPEVITVNDVFPPTPRSASPKDIEKAFRNTYSGVNATLITESVGSPKLDRSKPRNKYDHEIIPGVHVDVYDVLNAFPTGGADIDHAVKKLLQPGGRGHKDEITDYEEAIKSIQRGIDHIKEWESQ